MALTKDPAGNPAPPGGFQNYGWYSGFQIVDGSFAPRAGMVHPESNQVGAGQAVSQEVNRQTSVAAGLAPTANQEYVDRQNALLGPGQLQANLDQYQQTVYGSLGGDTIPSLTTGGAATPIDFESIRSRLTPTAPQPEPFSRVQKFEELRESYGVQDLETQLTELKNQQRETEAQLRVNLAAERGKPVAMNVVQARVTEQTRAAQENIDYLSRQQAYIVDQLNSAYAVINTYVTLGGQDYADAVDRYNTEFSQNLQLMELARGLQKDQTSEQQRQIDNARATLSTYVNAITSGNLNPASINADQKMVIRRLEAQSGLPIGFTESLNLSAKDKLVTYNERTGEALIMDGNGNFNVVKTGATPTPFASETGAGAGAGMTITQQGMTAQSEMDTLLKTQVNQYGDVPYQYWNKGKELWRNQGFDPAEYDRIFYQYVDINRQKLGADKKPTGVIEDYNLEKSKIK